MLNDLKPLPDNWQSELPDYYGCCEAIDKSVDHLVKVLDDDTIFVFTSDHGCHFMT